MIATTPWKSWISWATISPTSARARPAPKRETMQSSVRAGKVNCQPGSHHYLQSATPWATILGRTFVKDEGDLKNVFAIQDQYKLTPLSQWGKSEAQQPKGAEVWKPSDPKADPLAEWKTVNRAMIDVPPASRDADLLQSFARIGIGPGLDVDAQDASTKRGLARAAIDGKRIIAGAFQGGTCKSRSMVGIIRHPPPEGRPQAETGSSARCRCLRALSPTTPSRQRSINVSTDSEGRPLSGSNRYVIRFEKGGQPRSTRFGR